MSNTTQKYTFEGNPNRRPKKPHPDSPDKYEPYIASDELKQAINLAIYLRRPLLLEGEAGCGKTRLASAVAYELGLPLYRWDVRSTSKAQEGLYEYDAILRLHDVEMSKLGNQIDRDPSNAEKYITYGALGKAFQLKQCPAVVLIDEVDKADIDFPNDLLGVLEESRQGEAPYFAVRETGKKIQATHHPIVFITSNKEKGNLPMPFLRRCIYYFLEFPSKSEDLEQIVAAHYAARNESSPSNDLTKTAIKRFLKVRESGLIKKPGTSEFLDWLRVLANSAKPEDLKKLAEDSGLPFRELLVKLQIDWRKVGKPHESV
ncbi:AAA family ATPase [Pantanalinema rosaneae CENA516]|uniref:AAA family ATPase n=1 Tax=Pantanalinema rosaneae TaxID=1620701 RepID=UPI003D6DEC2B